MSVLRAARPATAEEITSAGATGRASVTAVGIRTTASVALLVAALVAASLMFNRGTFLDEADNLLGSCLMAQGKTLYVDFVSNHHPFHFYLLQIPYEIMGCDLYIQRYINLAVIFVAFLLSFIISRNMYCLVALILYLLLAPRYRGYFYLSEGFQAVGMFLLLTLTLQSKVSPRSPLYIAAYLFGQVVVVNSSILGIAGGALFPAYTLLKDRKNFLAAFASYLIALLSMVVVLLVDGNLDEFIYQGIVFQSQIYSKYLESSPANPIHVILTIYRHTIARVNQVVSIPSLDPSDPTSGYYDPEVFRALIEVVFLVVAAAYVVIARAGILPTLFVAGVLVFSLNRPVEHRALPFVAASLFLLTAAPGAGLWQRLKLVPLLAVLVLGYRMFVIYLPSDGLLAWGDPYAEHRDRYLAALTTPEDAVLGVPGDARFYLVNQRQPGSFYQFFMPWTSEAPGAQDQVIADIERNQVKLVKMESDRRIWGSPPVSEYANRVHQHVLANYAPVDRPQDGAPAYYLRRSAAWAPDPAQPGARAYHTGSQEVPDDRPVALAFDRERFDTGALHEPGDSRLVVPVSGTYAIIGNAAFAEGERGSRRLALVLNGRDPIAARDVPAPAGKRLNLSVSAVRRLEAGEFVELQAAQTSGRPLAVVNDAASNREFVPELMLVRIGDAGLGLPTGLSGLPLAPGGFAGLLGRDPSEAVRVYRDDRQRIDAEKTVALSFDAEDYDGGGRHDPERDTSRLTARRPGRYLIIGNVSFEEQADGWREAMIRLNGRQTIAFESAPAPREGEARLSVATVWDLGMLDYVELTVRQSSGKRVAVQDTPAAPTDFAMIRLSD